MENIRILETSEFLKERIPMECLPKRFAIATNLFLCARIEEDTRGLLLFNYEPEKWNQWYPYFSSVNALYDFKGETYGDIVNIFYNEILSREDVRTRFYKAKHNFSLQLNIPEEEIIIEKSPVNSEMWLKYSKTQDLWTFYYIEFLTIKKIPKIDFSSLDSNTVDFIPLTQSVINEVLKTGKFRGVDVVDNTLDLFKNKKIINDIIKDSVII